MASGDIVNGDPRGVNFHVKEFWPRPINVGRGGALVESKPLDRRVVGSNPALAATLGPWASL